MTHDQSPAAALALTGPVQSATLADEDPDFETEAEEQAYWQGIAVGIRAVGASPSPELREQAGGYAPLLDVDLDAVPEPPPGPMAPSIRSDGWTPQRQRRFLEALADKGSVHDAARAAGMSAAGAYALRRRKGYRGFRLAWDAAVYHARGALAAELQSRAMDGFTETWDKDGVIVTRHRHDNRLAMSVLTRLDRQAESWGNEAKTVRAAADDFEGFLDAIEAGTDAADTFIAACVPPAQHGAPIAPAALTDKALIARLGSHKRYANVPPNQIRTSDLDIDDRDNWDDDQWERAYRSGFLDGHEDELEEDDEDEPSPAAGENTPEDDETPPLLDPGSSPG